MVLHVSTPHLRYRPARRWVACRQELGEACGWILAGAVSGALASPLISLVPLLGIALAGLPVALAQGLVLRERHPAATLWLLLTILGAQVANALALAPLLLLAIAFHQLPPIWQTEATLFRLAGLPAGLLLGLAQLLPLLLLRSERGAVTRDAVWWLLASLLGWAMFWLLAAPVSFDGTLPEPYRIGQAALGGGLASALTVIPLRAFLQPRP
ncbi:MAG: hypothetical protein IT307_14015 [Chloroflexi bacterium]|nr:hypothetical protein [Chloroflexota bacterium]